jgi:di/tricarboxylate transporter
VMTVAIASCCAFASPVTYQTHLIVYGPGGYRFTDFVKVGLPLDLICAVVALCLIPYVFPLV